MAAHVLPTRASPYMPTQMSYGNDFYPGFDGLQAGHYSYAPHAQQTNLMAAPSTAHSDRSFRRHSSHSPRADLGAAAVQDRTPIQHYKPSGTRGRSHSRSELLLAYAEQNQSHQSPSLRSMAVMPSHGGSEPRHMFNMPSYSLSPPVTNFGHADDLFAPAVPPTIAHQDATTLIQHENEGVLQAFYQVGRASPHRSSMNLSQQHHSDPVNVLYATEQAQPSQQPVPSSGLVTHPFPPVTLTLESSSGDVEIRPSRPKPQCWDHGCNGRQFSTFSNLLRHQREKSGSAMKAVCPHCGTEFTRTTARNGHMSGGKCKGKADAEASNEV